MKLLRAFLWVVFITGFTLWQIEWAALATIRHVVVAQAPCACQGTTTCCCLHHPSWGCPVRFVPITHDAPQPGATDCRLQSAGCHESTVVIAQRLQRDEVLPHQVIMLMRSAAFRSLLLEGRTVPHAVSLDPPFVPPESAHS